MYMRFLQKERYMWFLKTIPMFLFMWHSGSNRGTMQTAVPWEAWGIRHLKVKAEWNFPQLIEIDLIGKKQVLMGTESTDPIA